MAPLRGLRVVELGNLVSAPYCAMLLGDLGADVIKVEPPEGDISRSLHPFVHGESAFFMSVNRNKRSLVLDLKDQHQRKWLLEVIDASDILVHNFRVGVMERLGLGDQELGERNRRLIYCALSAFGPSGPDALRSGVDLIFQAESGMMAVTGEENGPPVKIGTNAADVYGATVAALSITAAINGRSRSGRGCRVDVSLRDCLIALQACWSAIYLTTGEQPPRLGTASPITAPSQVFQTSDSAIAVSVVSDRHWRLFCSVLGLSDTVAEGPHFVSNTARIAHRRELDEVLSPVFSGLTTDEWIERFAEIGLPAGRVLTYEDVFAAPQVLHRGMLREVHHPRAGSVRMVGSPYRFDDLQARAAPAPTLGQHSREILAEVGCPPDEIRRLCAPADADAGSCSSDQTLTRLDSTRV